LIGLLIVVTGVVERISVVGLTVLVVLLLLAADGGKLDAVLLFSLAILRLLFFVFVLLLETLFFQLFLGQFVVFNLGGAQLALHSFNVGILIFAFERRRLALILDSELGAQFSQSFLLFVRLLRYLAPVLREHDDVLTCVRAFRCDFSKFPL